MDSPLMPKNPGGRGLNNEGETARQERTEPKESKAKENAEIKAFAKTGKPQSMYDAKPGGKLGHEHLFGK